MDDVRPVRLKSPDGASTGALLLQHRPAAVSPARRALDHELARWHVGERVREEVAVVVSEMLGNAVRHAAPLDQGHLLLRWRVSEHAVDVEVVDGGGGPVRVLHAGAGATGGRGMHLVAALSQSWGTADEAGGRRAVWASVRTTPVAVAV